MTLECRGSREAAIKILPDARGQVVNRLRSAVAEHYASRLLSKPDQGKVFEVSDEQSFYPWRQLHTLR